MPYIFRTRPHLSVKIWGGRRLETMFGKDLPTREPFGESWEVADLPEGQCVVDTGPMRDRTLEEVVTAWGAELTGTLARGARFPLLLKILDAERDLSVQVHPGQQHLEAFPEARPKDETWIILGVEDGGSVLHGFSQSVSPDRFVQAVEDGDVIEFLRRIEVAPGDVLRVPPGTVHAICRGVVLLEIQEPSDTTYRVYDYGRPGLDGKPRELHIEEAVAVANFSGFVGEKTGSHPPRIGENHRWSLLVDVYAYRVERLEIDSELSWSVDPRSVQILHVISGRCRVGDGDLVLERGQTAVIPACSASVRVSTEEGVDVAVCGLGGVPLVAPPSTL
ncbi:MAG: type I phosphomannose isomerase catalytic subunit [Bradymonadaceae bacterium]